MKYIFLDIDGVLATNSTYGVGTKNKWGSYMFDVKCVAAFNFILQETGAEIILSSDWRNTYTLQEMREIFAHNCVIKGPIGFTPSMKTYKGDNLEGGRADEIKAWLELHAWKNDVKWVAVDDLNMDEWLHPNFVLCPNHQDGIKRKGIRETIIEKLNGKLG
jgi:hypothetical protein